MGISGNQASLGNWDPSKALLMSDIDFPDWQAEIDAKKINFPLEYKFILYNKKTKQCVAWENNHNRYLAQGPQNPNQTLVIADRYVYFDLPAWKGSGVAVPIFRLEERRLG